MCPAVRLPDRHSTIGAPGSTLAHSPVQMTSGNLTAGHISQIQGQCAVSAMYCGCELPSKTSTCVEVLKGIRKPESEEGFPHFKEVRFAEGDKQRVLVASRNREFGVEERPSTDMQVIVVGSFPVDKRRFRSRAFGSQSHR